MKTADVEGTTDNDPRGPHEAGTGLLADYLERIGRTRLLTREEEIQLAKRIEAGVYAEHLLTQHPGDHDGDARAALLAVAEDGAAATRQMLEANLRLVVSVAKRYVGHGIPLPDLIQEGNIGLIHAVRKHDYKLGFKFSTYATWWIRQSITRALTDQSRLVRLPARVVDQLNRVARARRELVGRLGRQPQAEELARESGMTVLDIIELQAYDQEPASLDQHIGEDATVSLADLIRQREHGDDLVDSVSYRLLRADINATLATLQPRERDVISRRCGLDDGHQRTLEEIGREFGVTKERIRQIERRTLRKLREPERCERLHKYVG